MLILDNPEFKRLTRSKLRLRSVIMYASAAALLFGGMLALNYFIEKDRSAWMGSFSIKNVMHTYFFTVAGIQLALMALYGVALSAQNITLEKERGTFDFQRLVAMGPWRLTIGKLFGAPAEAFVMGAMGIPFAVVGSLGGGVPFSVLAQTQIVVFVYGTVACALGLMCSSIAEKTSKATGIVALLGIPFYSVFNNWNANSLWVSSNPIFMLKHFSGNDYTFGSATFPCLGLDVPIIFGFLLINFLLVLLCVTITARRIAEVELSFMTPRQGIIAFLVFQLLLIIDLASHDFRRNTDALQVFHGANLGALMLLAFALTPGAELVRGRVSRAETNKHWSVVFERTNRLQDSPGLRVMFEICAIYLAASIFFALVVDSKTAGVMNDTPHQSALLTLMVASAGIAASALLLYIQVYAERGCFKIGMVVLFLGMLLPILVVWTLSMLNDKIKEGHLALVNPIAYIADLRKLPQYDAEYACPLCCAVLAVAFCVLAGMRIRFLLDVESEAQKRHLKNIQK